MEKVYIILILATLLGCKRDTNSFSLVKVNENTFDIGFIANHRFVGIVNDLKNGDTLFYFGDPTTRKLIRFYSTEGALKFETSLANVRDTLNNIQHFEVVSPDTIFVFGQYNNKIAIINRKGEIWRFLDLQETIKPYNGYSLNYVPSYGGKTISGTDLVLGVEYLAKSKELPTTRLPYYFAESLDVPYFLKLSNIYQDSIGYQFGLIGFYRRFMTDSSAMTELMRYSVMDNEVAVFSAFSDTVYFVDNNSLEVNRTLNISSEYSTLKAKPIDLFSGTDYTDYTNKHVKYKGYISKLMKDEVNDLFVISVVCENKKQEPLERDQSFLYYTVDGNKLYEKYLDKDHYITSLFYQNNGTYYLVPKTSLIRDNGQNIFNFEAYEIRT